MSFPQELINQFAPGADCVPAMKIWKLPDGKENMFPELCNNGDYFAELKKDGYWYQFEKTDKNSYLFSRNVSTSTGILTEKLANVPHIKAALDSLPIGTILIGEIYYPGKTSKDVTRIMGCLAPEAIKRQETNGLIHFYLHDIIKYNNVDIKNEGAWNRYLVLKAVWNKFSLGSYDFMELAEAITENIQEETAAALANGEEGMVLKKKDVGYFPDKRPAWSSIKIKKMDYVDAICIGYCDATKDYTGKELSSWEYWEKGTATYYDCFEEDHCFAGYNWELVKGNCYQDYNYSKACSWNRDLTQYRPVTKPYFYGWKTAIKIGAVDKDGTIKEIGTIASGLNDELREDFVKNPKYYMNKVVSIQCMEKDCKEHTLRHGFFKGFRDDKDWSDCTLDSIF